ncbi:MAG: patatin-like phospholipase family protein [Gammaproteobacteria bacterium]
MTAEPRTALVLSGGGSLGAVQVGMLQALSRAAPRADMIIGASVGALNAAFFAADPTPAGADALAVLWSGLRRHDIFPGSLLTAALKALLLHRDYLLEDRGLRALIRRGLHLRRIEDARLALHLVATDALTGSEVLLDSGEIESALLASSAIPLVFPQVQLAGRLLVDGGVSSNTPIASAVALGAERILVLPTGTSCAAPAPPRGLAALSLHVLNLMSMRQLDRDVQIYAGEARISIVPPLCPLGVTVFDFSETSALIARAAAQTRDWLAAGGVDQTGPLHVPLAHHHRHLSAEHAHG